MKKQTATITHEEAKRKNIPSAEHQSVVSEDTRNSIKVAYARRNKDLDPQLVWRGKDEQNESDLKVSAPPLYIQERIHSKVLIDDLIQETKQRDQHKEEDSPNLFADFNGIPEGVDKTEFYQHDQNWSNRMILGDSLLVMASLAEREAMRGKVQCIYLDPPYGIKFNSNFQWSTTDRKPKDGKSENITREPEQVKAFRDTWQDGIHSYLTYLRDRLTIARELLHESGSIFIQIGDENVHRVKSIMQEVFGEDNYVGTITIQKSGGVDKPGLTRTVDYLLWFAKHKPSAKFRKLHTDRKKGDPALDDYNLIDGYGIESRRLTPEEKETGNLPEGADRYQLTSLVADGGQKKSPEIQFQGQVYSVSSIKHWSTTEEGNYRLIKANRIAKGNTIIRYRRFLKDLSVIAINDRWDGMMIGTEQFYYVVQTSTKVIQRCILLCTDPGDLVLDPTCGSGTTAHVAEQWGRRWITIDTSRVSLALARARLMGARYPHYHLADSVAGKEAESKITGKPCAAGECYNDIRKGFVNERVPRITLGSIAHNLEIDEIWDKYQVLLEPIRTQLNQKLGEQWQEWQVPRDAVDSWSSEEKELHKQWWQHKINRQKEIDASIDKNAETIYLYDKPVEDKSRVRVSGPFTVESASAERYLPVDENGDVIENKIAPAADGGAKSATDFEQMILENLKTAGVQQAHKEDKIEFTALTPWPGDLVCAEGNYIDGAENKGKMKKAGIFIGPEFGTVSRYDLVEAAREAADADFDVLIACAFNYEALVSDFDKLGKIPVLKATINADLHMADDLKNTGKGNLFVIFGEPDIDIIEAEDNRLKVKINGVDVFDPKTGEVRSDGTDTIACWFVDTNYNMESFFVRHAYFLGAIKDSYKSLKTTLKAEIDQDAWQSLRSDTSRSFAKPESGRIAVKAINHLGDEVMKVFKVP